MRPLAAPGIPWISVTLFLVKYSSQVALRKREEQKRPQSCVVTVSFPSQASLAQTSKPWRDSVRFPRRQILRREASKEVGRTRPLPGFTVESLGVLKTKIFWVPHPEILVLSGARQRVWSSQASLACRQGREQACWCYCAQHHGQQPWSPVLCLRDRGNSVLEEQENQRGPEPWVLSSGFFSTLGKVSKLRLSIPGG